MWGVAGARKARPGQRSVALLGQPSPGQFWVCAEESREFSLLHSHHLKRLPVSAGSERAVT